MYKILVCVILLTSPLLLSAQKPVVDSAVKFVSLDEVVISANRFTEKKKNVAQKIDVISSGYIAGANTQNTGDLLMSTGNIFVQKSQLGGSSPIIRGFEASRVLLVVDGVRMNNAIYRAGHLQNVITVDQQMLERAEVMYGPSSTLYGSDALGGVMNFKTRIPVLAGENKSSVFSGSAFTRYSSANHEKTGHLHFNVGFKKWAFLASGTFSDFGDLKIGSRDLKNFPGFGRRPYYIDQVNGIDSILVNKDDRIQKFSGYRQWDFMQKLLFTQNEQITHTLNLQFSNSSNIPRYDRLQDIRNGNLRYAAWYYGPQQRNMAVYELNLNHLNGFFNQLRANLSYQDIHESRHTREFRRYDRLDSRMEKVKVAALTLDARKGWGRNELSAGLDAQLNNVMSRANRTNILTGTQSKLDTRYPDGKNNMNNFAAFAQHTLKMFDGKLVLNEGLRIQTSILHSTIADTVTQLHLPYTDIRQKNLAVTGNLGLVYNGDDNLRLSTVLSSGFRAPNIDDLSRIFESSTSAAQLVVPNPDIKPEYTYNVDLGITKILMKKIKLELTGFYTWFNDAIATGAFLYKGQDSIVYQGVKSQVIANQNINHAFIYGFNASVAADFSKRFSASATINYTYGRYKTDPDLLTAVYEKQAYGSYQIVKKGVSSKPVDHIPPVFGKGTFLYQQSRFSAECYVIYNGWKKLDQYNAEGEDNGQYATSQGTPSWYTVNFRSTVKISTMMTLQAAVENIADRNYRNFASGLSAPGRNYILALRCNF